MDVVHSELLWPFRQILEVGVRMVSSIIYTVRF